MRKYLIACEADKNIMHLYVSIWIGEHVFLIAESSVVTDDKIIEI